MQKFPYSKTAISKNIAHQEKWPIKTYTSRRVLSESIESSPIFSEKELASPPFWIFRECITWLLFFFSSVQGPWTNRVSTQIDTFDKKNIVIFPEGRGGGSFLFNHLKSLENWKCSFWGVLVNFSEKEPLIYISIHKFRKINFSILSIPERIKFIWLMPGIFRWIKSQPKANRTKSFWYVNGKKRQNEFFSTR